MQYHHLVRIGQFGQVGRFSGVDSSIFPRSSRVVCRTSRGLEMGEVLAANTNRGDEQFDGQLLRGMTTQDELLLTRIEKNKNQAYQACAELLQQTGSTAALMDVELLLDGSSMFFYFLGDPPPEVDQMTAELADAYNAKVQVREFATLLDTGCGPGCGEEASSCGTDGGGCSSCGLSSGCSS